MAKNSIRDFDATSSNNTDIQSVDISEGCSPAGINNAIRELMADIKDVSAGTVALESPQADSLTVTGDLTVDTSTLKVDSTNNRVGILEASPAVPLEVKGAQGYASSASNLSTSTSTAAAKIRGSNDATTSLFFGSLTNDAEQYIQSANYNGSAADDIALNPFGGTVLVGKVTSDFDGGVFEAGPGGTFVSRSGTPFAVNRNGSDGQLVNFYKDGSTAGSIGSLFGTTLYVSSSQAGGLRFTFTSSNPIILPCDTTGGSIDNSADLGASSVRFRDVYSAGGVTTTSDQNEKQQIASLTDAEIAAAKRISAGFKTFKWNDAVAEKGDSARTHAGVIAQQVRTSLEAEGLDAGDYAFFMSNTWWEHDVEVPAVEAREAVYDDDGNLVTEAIEAIDAVKAHTRRDVYYTADEAPEGATERTRLGIRYAELMAFIGAATEQRLTHLETLEARIEALENA